MNNTRTYALNSKGILVKASETKKEEDSFFCINCKEKMGIRKGNKRIHHFYHLNLECSDETYLHKLAKTILFNKINENRTNSKEIGIGLQKSTTTTSYESTNGLFGPEPIENINDRIDSIICNNLIDFFDSEIELKERLKNFFKQVKETKNKQLIDIFIKFHKWLNQRITYYINMKINYAQKDKYKYIKKWQSIQNNWYKIKDENKLIEKLLFVDQFLNIRRHRFEEIYDDHILIIDYFSNISKKNKILLIENCYHPHYSLKEKEEYKDIFLNFNDVKEIYLDNKKHKGYLADILTIDNNDVPIFWEIAVSHKCDQEKINSNIRIIEILIKNNEDIELLSNLDFYGLTLSIYNF